MAVSEAQDRSDDVAELVTEVVVVPAVEPRVGARRRHAKDMTHGVYDEHRLLILGLLERIVEIEDEIVDVEWHPAESEYEGDRHQQGIETSQPLLRFGIIIRHHVGSSVDGCNSRMSDGNRRGSLMGGKREGIHNIFVCKIN